MPLTSAWHIKLTVSPGNWGAHLCSWTTQLGLLSSTSNHLSSPWHVPCAHLYLDFEKAIILSPESISAWGQGPIMEEVHLWSSPYGCLRTPITDHYQWVPSLILQRNHRCRISALSKLTARKWDNQKNKSGNFCSLFNYLFFFIPTSSRALVPIKT